MNGAIPNPFLRHGDSVAPFADTLDAPSLRGFHLETHGFRFDASRVEVCASGQCGAGSCHAPRFIGHERRIRPIRAPFRLDQERKTQTGRQGNRGLKSLLQPLQHQRRVLAAQRPRRLQPAQQVRNRSGRIRVRETVRRVCDSCRDLFRQGVIEPFEKRIFACRRAHLRSQQSVVAHRRSGPGDSRPRPLRTVVAHSLAS